MYCRKKLGLDPEKINVNGGAMAIGHPLGATGTEIIYLCLGTHLLDFYPCAESVLKTLVNAVSLNET